MSALGPGRYSQAADWTSEEVAIARRMLDLIAPVIEHGASAVKAVTTAAAAAEKQQGGLNPDAEIPSSRAPEIQPEDAVRLARRRFADASTCIRYYRAYSRKLGKAVEALAQTVVWREEVNPRCPLCTADPSAHSLRLVGFDSRARPVMYTSLQQALRRHDAEASALHMVQALEEATELMRVCNAAADAAAAVAAAATTTDDAGDAAAAAGADAAEECKRGADTTAGSPPAPCSRGQWVLIVDFVGYGLRDNNPMAGILLKQMLAHYPERLARAILVDAPMLFSGLWSVIHRLLDERTAAKVLFVKSAAMADCLKQTPLPVPSLACPVLPSPPLLAAFPGEAPAAGATAALGTGMGAGAFLGPGAAVEAKGDGTGSSGSEAGAGSPAPSALMSPRTAMAPFSPASAPSPAPSPALSPSPSPSPAPAAAAAAVAEESDVRGKMGLDWELFAWLCEEVALNRTQPVGVAVHKKQT